MALNTMHSAYESRREQVKRTRDCLAGTDRIKEEGTEYLPQLGGQDAPSYNAYKKRALFVGATQRTHRGFLGSVFRLEPTAELPTTLPHPDFLDDVTATMTPLELLAKRVMAEVLSVGRVGVRLLLPVDLTNRPRPYMAIVPTEAIVNWDDAAPGEVPQWIVLHESAPVVGEDRYERKTEDRWRLLELIDGFYEVSLWRKAEQGEGFEEVERFQPLLNGQRLDFIPLTVISGDGLDLTPAIPPMLPLVDANFDHYRLMADYRHGLHFTGLPTPWVAGFDADNELYIGSQTAWVTSNPNAKAGMLEFTGQGLTPLKEAIEGVADVMVALGAQMLEQQKRAAETAETHRMRQAAEQVTVQDVARACSLGMTVVLRQYFLLAGTPPAAVEQISYTLNQDLVEAGMPPDELTALVKGWQAGAYSYDALFWNLKKGERVPPETDAEQELDKIKTQAPLSLFPGLVDGGPDE